MRRFIRCGLGHNAGEKRASAATKAAPPPAVNSNRVPPAAQGFGLPADSTEMNSIPTPFTLSLDGARLIDFTDYLALDGVTLTFDEQDLMSLASARDVARKLADEGKGTDIATSGPEVEFHGLGGLHELEIESVTIDCVGKIVIRAEVRHGKGEGVEFAVALDELRDAAKP